MLRFILLSLLLTLLLRAVLRLWAGVMEGVRGPSAGSRSRPPQRGVQMVRDPICGTFVVPDRAVPLLLGSERLYFCSAACRDRYRAQPRSEPADAHDRIA
jgi:YHS domain-containing protein